MDENNIFKNCKSGLDFEIRTVEFLRISGFKADKTGKNDGGIDIVATFDIKDKHYKFYIQCKYFNTTLSKHPVQEVYAGAKYYEESSGAGTPVVITNNRVTREARLYAKRLGVEIIGDAEWTEIKQVVRDRKATNPNISHGILGIIISQILEAFNSEQATSYLEAVLQEPSTEINNVDTEDIVLQIKNEFDEAEEYIKESERLYLRATQNQQRAMNIHRDAIIRHLKYG